MGDLFIPILLVGLAIIAAFATYRGIRRGGARFYTLEREALLRRASLTLFISVLLFSGAVGWLVYDRQQLVTPEEAETGTATAVAAADNAAVAESTPELESMLALPTSTVPPPPSATPTPPVCRAIVEGTFDNGLTLRETPNGEEIDVIAESSIVTLLTDEEPVQDTFYTWVKVRTLFLDEGWVALDFLTLGDGCE